MATETFNRQTFDNNNAKLKAAMGLLETLKGLDTYHIDKAKTAINYLTVENNYKLKELKK